MLILMYVIQWSLFYKFFSLDVYLISLNLYMYSICFHKYYIHIQHICLRLSFLSNRLHIYLIEVNLNMIFCKHLSISVHLFVHLMWLSEWASIWAFPFIKRRKLFCLIICNDSTSYNFVSINSQVVCSWTIKYLC